MSGFSCARHSYTQCSCAAAVVQHWCGSRSEAVEMLHPSLQQCCIISRLEFFWQQQLQQYSCGPGSSLHWLRLLQLLQYTAHPKLAKAAGCSRQKPYPPVHLCSCVGGAPSQFVSCKQHLQQHTYRLLCLRTAAGAGLLPIMSRSVYCWRLQQCLSRAGG